MKAVKKVIAVAAGGAGLGAGTAFANYPVIDVANLTESIEQVYQTYMDIQQAIQSVQNQYVQIKHAIEAVKNIDWSKFKALGDPETWENPETIRNAYKAALSQYNSNLNRLRNVKNKINGKHIMIGGMKISAGELLGFDKNGNADSSARFNAADSAMQALRERRDKIRDAYARQLTWEERKAIMDKYGVSAENYAETQIAEDAVESAIKEVVYEAKEQRGLLTQEEKAAHEDMLKQIQEGMPESSTARADMQNSLLISAVKYAADSAGAFEDLMDDIDLQDKLNKAENEWEKKQRTEEYRNQCKQNENKNYPSTKAWI